MQIILSEDDAILNGGVPKNVMATIVLDSGKKVRVPYATSNRISQLYKAVKDIPQDAMASLPIQEAIPVSQEGVALNASKVDEVIVKADKPKAATVDTSSVIGKEDIVKMIKVEPRGEGASVEQYILGHEYRVIKVNAPGVVLPGTDYITKVPVSYEVVDDASGRPERLIVFPSEVVLVRKRKPAVAKVANKIEEILKCPTCQTQNVCALENGVFKGCCDGCKGDYTIERTLQKCPTEKCGNDVSLFLYGDTYTGKCNKCMSTVEADRG